MKLSNEKLATLLDNISEAIVAMDKTYQIVYFNRAAEKVFGYRVEEIVGRPLDLLIPERFAEVHRRHLRKLGKSDTVVMIKDRPELVAKRKDGVEFPVEVGISKITQDKDEFYTAIVIDITERKQTENTLRESEEKFRLFAERITEVFYLVDIRDNKTLYVSPGFEQVWGMLRSEVEKSPQNFMKAIHSDDLERVREGLVAQQTGLPFNLEYRIIRPDGVMRWIWDRGYPVPNANGTVDRYVGVAQDITERKRADEKLAASEAELRALFAAMHDAVLIIDNEGIYRKIAPTNPRLLYLPLEELLGKSLRDVFPPEEADKFLAATREVVRKHQTQHIEYQLVINEQPLWFSASITPLAEDSTVWVARDITERKTAEEALRKSEAQLSNAMKIANLGHWELDVATGIFTFTDNFYAIFRTNASEMGGYQMSVSDYARRFVLPEEGSRVGEEIRRGVETDDPNFNRYLEHRMLYADGSVGHIAVRYFIIKDDKGRTIKTYGVNQDITERKKAEELLRASEEKFHALIEHGSEAILLIDPQGRIFFGNPAAQQLLGHSLQEFLGRSGLDDVHPDDIKHVREILDSLLSESHSTQRLEYRLRHKDGTWRWIDTFATNSLHVPAIHGIVLNSRDITEHKQAELKIQEQLERLSALHQIALAITSDRSMDNILQILVDQVITRLNVDAASVLVANPYEQSLEFAVSRGFMNDVLYRTHLRFGQGYAGQAAMDQATIFIPDLRTHPIDYQRFPAFRAEGFVSYFAVPLVAKNEVKGVLEVFHRSPLERNTEWLDFLEALTSQAAIAIDNSTLFNDLQRLNSDLSLAYDATLEGWARALEVRDQETKGHSQRVAGLTLRLAKAMGIHERDLIHIHRGALLHDIGKLGVADSILLKAGPLDDAEREIMQKHPTLAFELLSPITHLRLALDIPYFHHEKWDGSGYPLGMKSENIPLSARIFAVVDVWDALTSDRPYRKAWPMPEVLSYIREQSGKHFDPQVVDAFLSLIDHDMADGADTGKNSN